MYLCSYMTDANAETNCPKDAQQIREISVSNTQHLGLTTLCLRALVHVMILRPHLWGHCPKAMFKQPPHLNLLLAATWLIAFNQLRSSGGGPGFSILYHDFLCSCAVPEASSPQLM